eukprot:CAMPEP_0172673322 /NCGR_PEP_ID=MMETSP1074-20121228/12077_1 /TAXON_ID=2916 /ORGANISM="Ceratium fusus, Strain PA161109" /LENGTH=32 /DNA_ID= /DNA_START= /DNA_END= /DNA_ORIENTATION=
MTLQLGGVAAQRPALPARAVVLRPRMLQEGLG